MNEKRIALANGNTICLGPGRMHKWGGYVRIEGADGREVGFWEKDEWWRDPEGAMAAILTSAETGVREKGP